MARIPEGVIERLKREVSIERLAEARGVKLDATVRTSLASAPSTKTTRRLWLSARRKISGTVSAHAGREPAHRLGDARRRHQLPSRRRLLREGISL